ncbi:MAG: LptA/OstA family protein [Candidatus Auribacterota bacterium]|nr:LptA/OstA family protein [Candidatus Auribacterota bacterium]
MKQIICGLLTAFALIGFGRADLQAEQQPEQTPTVITSDGPLEVDFTKNMAVFKENVCIKDERGEVYSDRMDVYFDNDSRQVHFVEALGNVVIYVNDKIAKSEKATYKVSEGLLVLTGNPRIMEDKNIYSADKITIFRKDGQTEMKLEPRAKLILYRDEKDNGSGLLF